MTARPVKPAATDVVAHATLKDIGANVGSGRSAARNSYLQSLGISLRSATEPIDDTSTGKLMEGVLGAPSRNSTTTCARIARGPA
jgi:hypothetical protein